MILLQQHGHIGESIIINDHRSDKVAVELILSFIVDIEKEVGVMSSSWYLDCHQWLLLFQIFQMEAKMQLKKYRAGVLNKQLVIGYLLIFKINI